MSSAQAQRKPIEVVLPELHVNQQRILAESRRFNVLACGRRFGKTTLGLDLLIDKALDGYPVGWFSPTYKMLTEVWREACHTLKSITTKSQTQEHRLELLTNGVIDMWSLENPDSSRGRKYARIIIDEAAMVPNLADAWQAAIYPTLTDYQGDAFLLSTPKGVNFFHECFGRGLDPDQSDWMGWQMVTTDNPFIQPKEVEIAQRELPEQVFKQEYLAEFIQSDGAVFRNIEACLTAFETAPEHHRGHRIVAGVDWGQKNDFTAISVVCASCHREVDLDRFNKIDWAFQRARLRSMIEKWSIGDTLVETNSIGSPNLEALILENLRVRGFETTAASKSPLIQSLALAFERMECQWMADAVAKTELLAYESKINAITGRVSYSAPEGGHDDTVMARALAWECVQKGSLGNAY